MKKILFYSLAFLFFTACQHGSSEQQMDSYSNETSTATKAGSFSRSDNRQPGQAIPVSTTERKIIRIVNFSMEVADVEKTTAKIESLLEGYEAYLQSSNLNNQRYRVTQSFTIRVPQDKLDELLSKIGEEAVKIDSKNVTARDVTEEFIDVETRLNTKKQIRDRYIDILNNKAKTIEDVLNVEDRIRVIQEEIEAKEGRLKYLKNQVGYSTINLTIYKQQDRPVYEESYFSKIGDAFAGGWDLIKELFIGMIMIWPILIILILIIWWWRRRRRNKEL